jgi:DNA invertase Pin-like site-specific DNA recombinase
VTPAAVGYLRVSTSEQAGSGLGLEAQAAAIETTAARLGLTVGETFNDAGISGGLPLEQRPGLLAALEALGKDGTLIVAKRDRLGRDVLNVAIIERLAQRKGARIVSAAGEGTESDEPTSVLMRQIIDSFAQYERALIRARTKAALGAKRARGERVGTLPFGFQLSADGRTLEPNPLEQQTLALIRELRASKYTLERIAAELNQRGYVTRRGTTFKFRYVGHLLAA